jgi:hypothetical protein
MDEAGYDFGFEVEDAPMDLTQLGEASAKLCEAPKETGAITHIGCKVRPITAPKKLAQQPPSPAKAP